MSAEYDVFVCATGACVCVCVCVCVCLSCWVLKPAFVFWGLFLAGDESVQFISGTEQALFVSGMEQA